MNKWRTLKLLACVLVLCVVGACKGGAGDGHEVTGGDFLASDEAEPDDLWETGIAGTATKRSASRLQDLMAPDERAAFLEVGAHLVFGGQMRPGDRVDLLLSVEAEEQKREASGQDLEQESAPDRSARGVEKEVEKGVEKEVEKEGEKAVEKRWVIATLLQNVTVLGAEPVAASGPEERWSLAVSVTDSEARLLHASRPAGRLHALLRHPSDRDIGSVERVTFRRALENLQVLNRKRQNRQKARPLPDEAPASTAPLSRRVSHEHMRAFSLPVDISAPVVRHLAPGARIDVSATFELGMSDKLFERRSRFQVEKESVSMTLLQNVRVLGTRGAEVAPKEGDAAKTPLVVIEVDLDEAALLALASERGELDVALRAKDDHEFSGIARQTTRNVFEELEVISRVRQVRKRKRRRMRSTGDQIKIYRGGASRVSPSGNSRDSSKGKSKEGAKKRAPAKESSKPRAPLARAKARPSHQPAKARPSHQTGRPATGASPEADRAETAPDEDTAGIFRTAEVPRSTFALDVDTSSYTLVRRHLFEKELPSPELVRVEEFLNYFDYDNPWPKTKPFAVTVEGAPNPLRRSKRHKLIRIGVQAKRADDEGRKPINLTFLVDTSSSMRGGDRLGLVKSALVKLARELKRDDTIAIVGYSDRVEQVLGRTSAAELQTVARAIRGMSARGSTNMQEGMRRAYRLAHAGLDEGAENRVVILSDGDPNVGATEHEALLETVAEERAQGITLSTIGFGRGNYRDTLMEQLADRGDGNSYYVDDAQESERLFGERLLSTLVVVARDVKAQVEFDPQVVDSYRRVGYVNRSMTDDQWHDPGADAGEIGAGHRVTVLYEVKLAKQAVDTAEALGTVRVRYKRARGDESFEIAVPLSRASIQKSFDEASDDLRFAASVVGFAEVLERSALGERLSLTHIHQTAKEAAGEDPARLEFAQLVERAHKLRASSMAASTSDPGSTDGQKQARSESSD